MQFPAKIREQGGSTVITVPYEVVKTYNLKVNEIYQFEIRRVKDVDTNNANA